MDTIVEIIELQSTAAKLMLNVNVTRKTTSPAGACDVGQLEAGTGADVVSGTVVGAAVAVVATRVVVVGAAVEVTLEVRVVATVVGTVVGATVVGATVVAANVVVVVPAFTAQQRSVTTSATTTRKPTA